VTERGLRFLIFLMIPKSRHIRYRDTMRTLLVDHSQ